MQKPSHVQILENEFHRRKFRNSAYSLRAYARDLGLGSSSLSEILSGSRNVPQKKAKQIVSQLNLQIDDRIRFLKSVEVQSVGLHTLTGSKYVSSDSLEKMSLNETLHFKMMSGWEYCAVLQLTETANFSSNVGEIADRLGITFERAEIVVENLLLSEFMSRDENGCFVRNMGYVKTTRDVPYKSVRQLHKALLQKAIDSVEGVDVTRRYIANSIMAIDASKIDEAKKIIGEFRTRMGEFLSKGEKDEKKEVYNLGVQLFPITRSREEK